VDLDGNVLGINIARAGRVETWALPPDVVKPLIADLKAGKFPPPKATK
jgi:S1-C subfamily serine protease